MSHPKNDLDAKLKKLFAARAADLARQSGWGLRASPAISAKALLDAVAERLPVPEDASPTEKMAAADLMMRGIVRGHVFAGFERNLESYALLQLSRIRRTESGAQVCYVDAIAVVNEVHADYLAKENAPVDTKKAYSWCQRRVDWRLGDRGRDVARQARAIAAGAKLVPDMGNDVARQVEIRELSRLILRGVLGLGDKRITRLFRMIVQTKRTEQEMARALRVSTATIRRWKKMLKERIDSIVRSYHNDDQEGHRP